MSSEERTVTWVIEKAQGNVDLSISSATFTDSNTKTIAVSRLGTGTITAVSSNPKIVSITNINQTTGVITVKPLVKYGESTIVVSVAEDANYTKSNKGITLTVNNENASLNSYTWDEIADIIQTGDAEKYFKAGNYKDIIFPTEIALDSGKKIEANSTWRAYIIGINHNPELEGYNRVHFCIGKTTDGKEICLEDKKMNSMDTNSGGWNSCVMKTWLNETFYNALPTDLKNVITECTKYTDNTGRSSNSEGNVTSTSQKIWLMAEFEVFGTRTRANQYEQNKQAQYDYYKNGNSRVRYGHSSGSAQSWWLRSPYYRDEFVFCVVTSNGGIDGDYAANARRFVPCFTVS